MKAMFMKIMLQRFQLQDYKYYRCEIWIWLNQLAFIIKNPNYWTLKKKCWFFFKIKNFILKVQILIFLPFLITSFKTKLKAFSSTNNHFQFKMFYETKQKSSFMLFHHIKHWLDPIWVIHKNINESRKYPIQKKND